MRRWYLGWSLLALVVAGCLPPPNDPSESGPLVHCPDGYRLEGSEVSPSCVPVEAEAPPMTGGAAPSAWLGAWSISGVTPLGRPYRGTMFLEPAPDDPNKVNVRRALEASADATGVSSLLGETAAMTTGVGLQRGSILSVGLSGDERAEFGAAEFTVRDGGSLDGVWFHQGTRGIGRELLTGGDDSATGSYFIAEGRDAAGTPYAGRCDIGRSGDVFMLIWRVNSRTSPDRVDQFRGLGVRHDKTLTVGFSTAPNGPFGVLQLIRRGDGLEGRWAWWGQRSTTVGREVIERTGAPGARGTATPPSVSPLPPPWPPPAGTAPVPAEPSAGRSI